MLTLTVSLLSYWATLRKEILNCNTGQMAATASPLVMRPNLFVPDGVVRFSVLCVFVVEV